MASEDAKLAPPVRRGQWDMHDPGRAIQAGFTSMK